MPARAFGDPHHFRRTGVAKQRAEDEGATALELVDGYPVHLRVAEPSSAVAWKNAGT